MQSRSRHFQGDGKGHLQSRVGLGVDARGPVLVPVGARLLVVGAGQLDLVFGLEELDAEAFADVVGDVLNGQVSILFFIHRL